MNKKVTLVLTDILDDEHFEACVHELMRTLIVARHNAKLHFGNGSNVIIEAEVKAPVNNIEIKPVYVGDDKL